MKFIYLLFLFSIISCSQELTKADLLGTWEVVDFIYLSDEEQETVENIKELIIGTQYVFYENGTFQMNNEYVTERIIGTYLIFNSGQELKLLFESKNGTFKIFFKLKSFEKDDLRIIKKLNNGTRIQYILKREEKPIDLKKIFDLRRYF